MCEEDFSLIVPRWVWPLVVLALVLTAWAALYIHFGAIVAAPVVLAAASAFGLWMASTLTASPVSGGFCRCTSRS